MRELSVPEMVVFSHSLVLVIYAFFSPNMAFFCAVCNLNIENDLSIAPTQQRRYP
jgi:hypothetical protein